MEENKNKSRKGLVVTIVILIVLLLGSIGYICYDKFYQKEEPKKEVETKLSEEEVKELYESLIVDDQDGGIYTSLDRITTIDNVDSKKFQDFAVMNYIRDNNLYVDNKSKVYWDNDNGCHLIKPLIIRESDLNNYISQKYNATREFSDKSFLSKAEEDNCKTWGYFKIAGSWAVIYFDMTDNSYKIVSDDISSSDIYKNYDNVHHNKFIRSEQIDDEIFVYDKAFCFWNWADGSPLLTNCTQKTILEKDELNKYIANDYTIDSKYVFDNYSDQLNTYKHTFKKNSDNKYYWYSTEVVK